MSITLQPITSANWASCINLMPTDVQRERGDVAPNVLSLAQACIERWWRPVAIVADDTLVGFLLYGRWPATPIAPDYGQREAGIHHLLRFMIDHRHQRQGYGRAAMEQLILRVRRQHNARAIELNYDPANTAAAALYTRLGFEPTGEIDEGELRARLWLTP
jgi:diamine N-acetyltransferase